MIQYYCKSKPKLTLCRIALSVSFNLFFTGSTTACIVVLDKKSSTLHSANLGDSGFLVIRKQNVVHSSLGQQHYFNTPFQLAIPPPDQEGNVIQDK